MAALALGLDLGTTSVKLAVVRNLGHKFQRVHEASAEHGAYKTLEEHPERREQDVASILAAVRGLISDLGQRAALDDLSSIAVTGQMHGVVLWRRTGWSVSDLITWEDRRIVPSEWDVALELPSSGFGAATLAWLARHHPAELAGYDACGTVMDLLVWILCCDEGRGAEQAVQAEPTCCASFGWFDPAACRWRGDCFLRAGVDPALLPAVVPTGTVVGRVSPAAARDFGIPEGVPVLAAMGDNPCSVYGTLASELAPLGKPAVGDMDGRATSCTQRFTAAVLTVGTSAQMSLPINSANICDVARVAAGVVGVEADGSGAGAAAGDGGGDDGRELLSRALPGLEMRPFLLPATSLLVAASMNGGNVLASAARLVAGVHRSVAQQLTGDDGDEHGGEVASDEACVRAAFRCLIQEGLRARARVAGGRAPAVLGSFFPERRRAGAEVFGAGLCVQGILPGTTVGDLSLALHRNLAVGWQAMFPRQLLAACGVELIRCSGGAAMSNQLLRECVADAMGVRCEVAVSGCDSAAYGAAVYACMLSYMGP